MCTIFQRGGTPDVLNPLYWVGPHPWMSSGETSKLFVSDTEQHISDLAVNDCRLKLVPRESILIARSGQGHTRGQVSMNTVELYVNDGLIILQANRDLIDPYYLLYNLHYRYEEIRQLSDSNSCRGNINAKMLNDMEICLPTLSEQKTIVSILHNLSLKIDTNTRINANLGGARFAS